MLERRSLGWPITLGVLMIVFLVILTVGWVLLAVFGALGDNHLAPLFWTLLPVGSALFACLLVGTVMYLVISIRSIRLTRRQSNFLDSVTHELKSPIAAIKLYTQTLIRRPVSEEQRQRFLHEILEDVDRLDRLITQLLGVAKLQKHQDLGRIESLDVAQILTALGDDFVNANHLAAEQFVVDAQPARLIGRREELELIMRNLLDNARKYGNEPVRIHVRCGTTVTGGTEILVTDNGNGIPRAERRRVFDRFVRLGDELERKRPGTGLGLYIVKTLVSQRSGTVRILSGPNGLGTTVEIRFPQKVTRGRGSAPKVRRFRRPQQRPPPTDLRPRLRRTPLLPVRTNRPRCHRDPVPRWPKRRLSRNGSMKENGHILIVEDEEHIRRGIVFNLEARATG